jgi:hypothetical protein
MLFQSFQEAIALRTTDYRDRWWRGPSGTRATFEFCVYQQVLVYRHAEGVWYAGGDWWKTLLEPSPEPEGDPRASRFPAHRGALRFL